MKAYVINLEARTDRWRDAEKQAHFFPKGLTRVLAIEASSIPASEMIYLPSGVVATWKSHLFAYRRFLQDSADSHCLILEDDFIIKDSKEFVRSLDLSSGFDFLQLGFLTPHPSDYVYRVVWDLQSVALRVLSSISTFPFVKNQGIMRSRSLLENAKRPRKTVLHDIHAGGHAYVISRDFATGALGINNPVFLSTDGVFMSLAKSRAFKMGRVRKSLVGQSNSPSSVSARFIS